MKKFHIPAFFIVFCLLSSSLQAQNQIFFGIEGGLSKNLFNIIDEGDEITDPIGFEPVYGINLRGKLKNHFFVELGLLKKNYHSFMSLRSQEHEIFEYNLLTIQLPLRVGKQIHITEKLFVEALLGVNRSFVLTTEQGFISFCGTGMGHYTDNLGVQQ
jgi:hypothetical protein